MSDMDLNTIEFSDEQYVNYNHHVVNTFRSNGGDWRGLAGGPLLLLTIKGAKTGLARVYPVMNVPDGDQHIIVASKGGAPANPMWYYNLLAHPDVIVEDGSETFEATTHLLSGEAREKAFAKAVAVFPPFAEYQKKVTRENPSLSA